MKIDYRKKSETLYCFSPLVTLLTGALELACVLYAFATYRATPFGRTATLLVFLLAIFQFSEYAICSGGSIALWNKIGYAAIALLPATGVHLTELVTKKTFWTPLSYAAGIAVALLILIPGGAFITTYCTGTFVLFELDAFPSSVLGIYYFLFLLTPMAKLAVHLVRKQKNAHLILWMFLGYLSFLVPTLTVTLLFASSQSGIPSIMCGFAVLLACIVIFKILPLYHKKKSAKLKVV